MRITLAVLLLSASALAQTKPAAVTDACGPKGVVFDVKTDNSQHTLAQPEAGKAILYVVSHSGLACGPGGWCMMRVGLDGKWVGAFKRRPSSLYNFYFYVSVEPGEHHVCVNAQSGPGDMIALMHFTAEAGNVYYLGIQGAVSYAGYSRFLNAEPLDSDEGKYLIATSPLSVSQPKSPKK